MNTALSPDERAPYAARFAEVARDPGRPAWLASAQQLAFDAFVAQGWPNKKQEAWRFTDITPMRERELLPAPDAASTAGDLSQLLSQLDPALASLIGLGDARLVFLDGHLQHGAGAGATGPLQVQSLVSAMASAPLREDLGRHLRTDNAFVALNTAFMGDGAFVHIPAGLRAEQPICLVYLASLAGSTSFPRTLVLADPGSRATVLELHLGVEGRATLSNAVTELVLGADAQLAYHTIQSPSPVGFHVGHVAISQAAGSGLSVHSLSLDGRLVRNDIHSVLSGKGSTCNLDGVYLAAGKSHVDNQTTIDHAQPRTTSRESYRGAVEGAGHAVFSGRIVVRPGAAKTDARQTNRNLLLSDGAQVNSKPQLEIFTSDVKCAHGATTGRLDPDALFYLRARGIGERDAERILIRAFLQQGLEGIAAPAIRGALEGVLDRRIDRLMSGMRDPSGAGEVKG